MTWTVYMLKDPSGAPRYVGLTRQTLVNRLRNHIGEMGYVSKWIKEIFDNGQAPTIEALQSLEGFTSRAAAQIVEDAWIVRLLDDGYDLLNERVKRFRVEDLVE